MSHTPYARLVPCTEIDYAEFATLQLVEYARQLVNAGEVVPADGLVTARERLSDLTGDRLRPMGHTFFVAESALDGSRIGWTWISPPPLLLGPGHERIYWLSQLTVLESQRRLVGDARSSTQSNTIYAPLVPRNSGSASSIGTCLLVDSTNHTAMRSSPNS